ncbi:MAG: hypothetical protein AAEJ16_03390, partial [Arenicellales bacterium]
HFRDGTSQSRCVEIPRGEPENFPTADLHQSKFLSLAEPVLGDGALGLHERLIALAHAESIETLFG